MSHEQDLKAAAALMGRKGGLKGGKASTEAKQDASRRNLQAARDARWKKKKTA